MFLGWRFPGVAVPKARYQIPEEDAQHAAGAHQTRYAGRCAQHQMGGHFKIARGRLIVGYIFSTTTVSVAAAAVTVIAMMAMSRIIGRVSGGIASFTCCMQKRRKGD